MWSGMFILDREFFSSRIKDPDPGRRGQKSTGSGSATQDFRPGHFCLGVLCQRIERTSGAFDVMECIYMLCYLVYGTGIACPENIPCATGEVYLCHTLGQSCRASKSSQINISLASSNLLLPWGLGLISGCLVPPALLNGVDWCREDLAEQGGGSAGRTQGQVTITYYPASWLQAVLLLLPCLLTGVVDLGCCGSGSWPWLFYFSKMKDFIVEKI